MSAVIDNQTNDPALPDRIIASLQTVYDPEIPVNIYDLGLIYEIHIYEDHRAFVKMTLTAPNCPAAGMLPGQAEMAVRDTEGIEDARVELTFDPPFSQELMSDEAKLALGLL